MRTNKEEAVMPAIISSALTIYGVIENKKGPFDESVLLKLQDSVFFKRKKVTNEERDSFLLKVGIILGQCVVEALGGGWSLESRNIYEAQVVIDLPNHTVHYDPFEDAAKFITDPKRFPLTTAFRNLVKQVKENQ